jgi:ligand-binding sensor domain-containing protein
LHSEPFSNFTKQGIVKGEEVCCVSEDRTGNVWFSCKQAGVCRFDGKTCTHFDAPQGSASTGLQSILEEGERRIWLGGAKGRFRGDAPSFARFF